MTQLTREENRDAKIVALAAIAMAAFFVAGTLSDDVLKVYAGTLRIIDGQLPYRDFIPQVLPLANLLAAPAFMNLPAGAAALTMAAAANVAAALLMWRLILHAAGNRSAAMVAGLLCAAWNQQVGGYYFDQIAYLFALAAFVRYVLRPPGAGAGSTEGILLACAILSKQTIGAFAVAAFVIAILAFHGWRPLLRPRFLCTFALPFPILAGYLVAIEGVENFHVHTFVVPSDYGSKYKNYFRLYSDFATPWNLDLMEIWKDRSWGALVFYLVVVELYLSYVMVALCLLRRKMPRNLLFAYAFLLISTVWAAATPGRLYVHATFGFAGIAAITAHLLAATFASLGWRPVMRATFWATAIGFSAIALALGVRNQYMGEREASPVATKRLWPLGFDSVQIAAIKAAAVIAPTGKSYALFGEPYLNATALALGYAPLDPMLFYELASMVPENESLRRDWQMMMIRRFDARRPAFLLVGYTHPDNPVTLSIRSMAGLPMLAQYFKTAYPTLVTSVDGVSIYARNAVAPTPVAGSANPVRRAARAMSASAFQ